MIIPTPCVPIFVILVVWFLLPRVARLMIHTPTAISIFVCLCMVQLMAAFISMRCTLCGHFLQAPSTLMLVVGYAAAAGVMRWGGCGGWLWCGREPWGWRGGGGYGDPP